MKGISNMENLMEMELRYGKMENNIKVNIIWVKSRDLEFINLRMVVFMKDNGRMESNMALVK
jgi:hypothetical protein